MSGEYAIAKKLVADAINAAQQHAAMSADTQALAILATVLQELSKSRSRADLESYIAYSLDSLVESDLVITRGC